MKKHCLYILLLIIFMGSCTDSDFIVADQQLENTNFSLEEAKNFFEMQMEQHPVVTRTLTEAGRRLTPGDFTPQWDKAIASSQNNLACYDIPINAEFQYKAMYVTYEFGQAKVNRVKPTRNYWLSKTFKPNN